MGNAFRVPKSDLPGAAKQRSFVYSRKYFKAVDYALYISLIGVLSTVPFVDWETHLETDRTVFSSFRPWFRNWANSLYGIVEPPRPKQVRKISVLDEAY